MFKLLTFKSEWRCFCDLIQLLTPKTITRFQVFRLSYGEYRKFRAYIYECVCVCACVTGRLKAILLCDRCDLSATRMRCILLLTERERERERERHTHTHTLSLDIPLWN
jgi:hypothetical protein